MLIALGGLIVTGLGGLLFADGPLFLAGRFVDVASASIVLPIALAGVATVYQGVDRRRPSGSLTEPTGPPPQRRPSC